MHGLLVCPFPLHKTHSAGPLSVLIDWKSAWNSSWSIEPDLSLSIVFITACTSSKRRLSPKCRKAIRSSEASILFDPSRSTALNALTDVIWSDIGSLDKFLKTSPDIVPVPRHRRQFSTPIKMNERARAVKVVRPMPFKLKCSMQGLLTKLLSIFVPHADTPMRVQYVENVVKMSSFLCLHSEVASCQWEK